MRPNGFIGSETRKVHYRANPSEQSNYGDEYLHSQSRRTGVRDITYIRGEGAYCPLDDRSPSFRRGYFSDMKFPKEIWATRFDSLLKNDINGLKDWIKEGCSKRFTKHELSAMNRWKYIPMLLPFLGSTDTPYSELASLKVGQFIQRFFANGITCDEVDACHSEITITWFQAISQYKCNLATHRMPRLLTQTTWNVEGEKAICCS